MTAGRPRKVDPGTLFTFAHQFYWDFRRLAEGRTRWVLDKRKYDPELQSDVQLSPEQKARAAEVADEEVRSGRISESEKEGRRRDVEDAQLTATRYWLIREAEEECTKELRFKGEPDVIESLLDPHATASQIRELCKDAFMSRTINLGSEMREVEVPAWPIAAGSPLPTYLSQYAEEYVRALRDPRFPSCAVSARPSNRLKQFWFLSRALAGALFGVTTRTSINLVGSMRPEQLFHTARDGKPARRQRKRDKRSRSI